MLQMLFFEILRCCVHYVFVACIWCKMKLNQYSILDIREGKGEVYHWSALVDSILLFLFQIFFLYIIKT